MLTRKKEGTLEKEKINSERETISLEESDKVLARLKEHCSDEREIFGQLCIFAVAFSDKGDVVTADAYAEKMLLYADNAREKVCCLLWMGQLKERGRGLPGSVEDISLSHGPASRRNDDWYFLNNNLGYCLNQFGMHAEAIPFCLAAIGINPRRYNAYKNLGVALQGQGEYSKAADAYIEATRICPWDGRALNHLEEMVSREKERILDIGNIITIT